VAFFPHQISIRSQYKNTFIFLKKCARLTTLVDSHQFAHTCQAKPKIYVFLCFILCALFFVLGIWDWHSNFQRFPSQLFLCLSLIKIHAMNKTH
jgi:hypothetical protein